jgi:hypothetical protein
MIFCVSEALNKAEKIDQGTFVEFNIWERSHVEEWVRTNPEMLGEELLVLTVEFDQFVNSSDRLDILAVDRDSNLVVVELKRDSVAGYADLQAIRYAAMVSSMKVETAAPFYAAYRKKYHSEQLTLDEARQQITSFFDESEVSEFSTTPRIILCSEGFSREITTTVLWLNTAQLDITCVAITPYKVGDKIVIVPKVIIPLEDAKEYQIAIKDKHDEREQSKRINPSTLRVLLENQALKAGDPIFLKVGLPSHIQYQEGNPMFQATITGKLGRSDAIRWEHDGKEYSLSALASRVFKDLDPEHNEPAPLNGSTKWVNSSGITLWDLKDECLTKTA